MATPIDRLGRSGSGSGRAGLGFVRIGLIYGLGVRFGGLFGRLGQIGLMGHFA